MPTQKSGAEPGRPCRADGDELWWATTAKGKRQALNPPEKRVVVGELVQVDADPPGAPFAFVLGAPGRSAQLAKPVDTHLDHHVTCAATADVAGLGRALLRLAKVYARAARYQGVAGYGDALVVVDLAAGTVTAR